MCDALRKRVANARALLALVEGRCSRQSRRVGARALHGHVEVHRVWPSRPGRRLSTFFVPFLPRIFFFVFELSLRCYENKRKADMAYRSRAHRHPSHPRTPAAPARAPPRPGERGVTVWDCKPEYVESWLNNADNKRGWSGSQVRLTRLELANLPHLST